ncbi:2og-fe oxygenase family protein [Diaporthe eres]|nr:2og-fe oxygenase family protein [Diaporthe eres]
MSVGPAPTCPPVILRWDPGSRSVRAAECKLKFPLDHSDYTTVINMQQLLQDMQPATFGYKGQDVLDASYRKASKLDPSHFACTFSPHEIGIIDEVARILLPGFEDKTKPKKNTPCEPQVERVTVMRAELYKLDVYAGPSGHFKAHVNTPRSTEQIGSLVVCLPCVHQGGQLEVRHEGRTMTFDWSMPETARPEIQWAALYSDCEHEVMEVTSGHRITLTYNLYASSITGSQQVGNDLMDPTQLQFYDILHSLFLQENFMPDGGYLGVHCPHAYPHTSKSARLPSILKGADMVAWETFRSLGCGVRLRPVSDRSHTDNEELMYPLSESKRKETDSDNVDPSKENNDDQPMTDSGPPPSGSDANAVRASDQDDGDQPMADEPGPPASGSKHLATDANDAQAVQEGDGDQPVAVVPKVSAIGPERWMIDADEVEALQQELKEYQSLPTTDFHGLEPADLLVPRGNIGKKVEKVAAAEFERIGLPGGCLVLGDGLSFHTDPDLIDGDVGMGEVLDRWIDQKASRDEVTAKQPERVLYEEVAWLNHSGIHKEPQISYGIYGNEAETAIMYSTCGIVAEVPPYTMLKVLLGKE